MAAILDEARRLYARGFGVHWIVKNGKRPAHEGWGKGVRRTWKWLEANYLPGYGLGVETGGASPLPGGGYLANIDVDLKGGEEFLAAAVDVLERHFPGVWESAPLVRTGMGYRLFVRTETPLDSGNVHRVRETCRVKMPGSPISKEKRRELVTGGTFTDAEIDEGWRIRPNWEIDFMSAGKQVVLPPSRHPETGRRYEWARPLGVEALPLVKWHSEKRQSDTSTESAGGITQKIKLVNVDIRGRGLHENVIAMIEDCEGVTDRSASMLGVCSAMLDAGFTDAEILSVLTDKRHALGRAAFEHDERGDRPRGAAAKWVYKYTLVKAKELKDPKSYFTVTDEAPAVPALSPEAAAAQFSELTARPWRDELRLKPPTKHKPDPDPQACLHNTLLVLEHGVGARVFRRNEFTTYDHYGVDAPWRTGAKIGKIGETVTDDCVSHIIAYISDQFRFEPAEKHVEHAIKVLATRQGYHPVKDELDALPEWDHAPRLDTWLVKEFGARVPKELLEEYALSERVGALYLAQVFRKWLVASVTRTFEPGKKFDWMPIFQGGQGKGKTSVGDILFGETYKSERLPRDLDNKDAVIALDGMRVHEFNELKNMRRGELDVVKSFVSATSDKIRRPFGKRLEYRPRQIVFYGTTDQKTYLRDDAGNRRFMPVEISSRLNFGKLQRDREQLWAEALYRYRNGLEDVLYLDGDVAKIAEALQKSKMQNDESVFVYDPLEDWLKARIKAGDDLSAFKLEVLWRPGGPLNEFARNMIYQKAAAKALRELGAEDYTLHGRNCWRYPAKKEVVENPLSAAADEADLESLLG